jgi:hypothetical protein
MSTRDRLAWQTAAVVWTIGPMVVLGGGQYPLWVDLMVYTVTALMVVIGVGHIIDRRTGRYLPTDDTPPTDER